VDLVAVLEDHGIPVVDQRVPGIPKAFHPVGVMAHHTASPLGSGDIPSLNIVKHGRPDLSGPLSQLLLGRSGAVVAVSDGHCHHAGGGTQAAWDAYHNGQEPQRAVNPRNGVNGNYWFVGIEAENNGVGEPWPAHQYKMYVTVSAAFCHEFDWDPTVAVLGHSEWRPDKIDPAGFSMHQFRQDVSAHPFLTPTLERPPMLLIIRPGGTLYVVYDGGVMDHAGNNINAYAGAAVYQADAEGWNRYVDQNYRARHLMNKDLPADLKVNAKWPARIGG